MVREVLLKQYAVQILAQLPADREEARQVLALTEALLDATDAILAPQRRAALRVVAGSEDSSLSNTSAAMPLGSPR